MAGYGWTLNVGGTLYEIKSIEFTRQVNSLDSTIIDIGVRVPINQSATILFNASTFMRGLISSCNQTSPKVYSVLIAEEAFALKTQLARTSTGSVAVEVTNSDNTKTIHDYVEAILGDSGQYGSGYIDGTNNSSRYVPNTTNFLPNMKFTSTYRLTALDKFLKSTCGLMYWFDYTQKIIYYGESRYDRTSYALEAIDVREKKNSAVTEYTEVIIYGKSSGIKGTATQGSAPYKTIQYQYTDYAGVEELQRIAEQILRDKAPQGLRYEVDITTQRSINIALGPGDIVRVQWPFEGIDHIGIIRDMNYNGDTVTLGVGDKEVSAFDLLNEKLQLIMGVSETGSTMWYTGGWQNIGGGAEPAEWQLTIDDVSKISSFELALSIDSYKSAVEIEEANALIVIGVGHAANSTGVGTANSVAGLGSAIVHVGSGSAIVTNAEVSGMSNLVMADNYWASPFGYTTGVNTAIAIVNIPFIMAAQFGMATVKVECCDWGGYGLRSFESYLSHNNPYVQTSNTARATHWSVGANDAHELFYDVYLHYLIPGDWVNGSWFIWFKGVGCSMNIQSVSWSFQWIITHTHIAADSGHSDHLGTDSGHSDHGVVDSGHFNHAVSDAGHLTSGADEGHDHDVIPSTGGSSFPTNLDVWIYNDAHPTGIRVTPTDIPGGHKQTVSIGDVTSFLGNGLNEIVVYADTDGSANLTGTFISYGE